MKERVCDSYKEETPKKFLGKINGKYLCKICRRSVRKKHREKTINDSGIREDLTKLKSKIDREQGYAKKAYAKKVGRPVRSYGKNKEMPTIKGSKQQLRKERSSAYLTFEEKKQLVSMLIQRGLTYEEAIKRVRDIIREQTRVRKIMKEEKKSEEEIKIKQRELLEELWRY